MTRSSNQDLIQPFENPKRVFQSLRKLFKTQSLDYLSSLEFSLISDLEDQFKEEETKTIKGPTMEEHMTRTRDGYGTGIARPKIDEKVQYVPTRQILDSKGVIPSMKAADVKKAIQDMADHSQKWYNGTSTRCRSTKTSDGLATIQAQLNNLGREIKKVNEKVYAGGQYRAATLKFYQRNNGNPSYQKRRQSMEESLGKFMAKSAKRHEENSNLIKEIRASTDDAIRNQGASIKALEIQIGQMSKVLQERESGSLPSLTETNPRDHANSISTTVETDTTPLRCTGPIRYAVSVQQNNKLFSVPNQVIIPFPSRLYDDCCDEEDGSYGLKNLDVYSIGTTLLNDALPIKEKDPGSIPLPCIINNFCFNNALADIGTRFSVMPFSTYTKRGIGALAPTKLIVELTDRTMKRPKGIVGIDKFVFLVDFIVLDMPEDIKTPLILGRPFFSTAHAKINVFKRKIILRVGIDKIVFESDKPTSNIIKRVYALSLRERMELDLEARIAGDDLIFNRSLDPLYGDYIELNDLNEPLELRRNQVDDLEPTTEEGEVVDEPMMDIVKN
nr:hypothetical protein [Tanacetum cinerariifolium]